MLNNLCVCVGGVRLGFDGVHLRPPVAWASDCSGAVALLLLVLCYMYLHCCGGSVLVFVLVCIALCPF